MLTVFAIEQRSAASQAVQTHRWKRTKSTRRAERKQVVALPVSLRSQRKDAVAWPVSRGLCWPPLLRQEGLMLASLSQPERDPSQQRLLDRIAAGGERAELVRRDRRGIPGGIGGERA